MTHSVHSRHLLTGILTVGMTALGLSFPARASAQSPAGAGAAAAEHATFLLLKNADTMVVENATRSAGRLSGQVVIRGQGMRFVYQADVGACLSEADAQVQARA
jgi:glucokinase